MLIHCVVTSLSQHCTSDEPCIPEIRFTPDVELFCFRRYLKITLIHCSVECLLRQGRCEYVAYNRRYLTCSLCEGAKHGLSTKYLHDNQLVKVSTLDGELRQHFTGLCLNIVCSRTQMCRPDTGDCVNSQCDLLPPVPGTSLPDVMFSELGATIKYECLDGIVLPLCAYVFHCNIDANWIDRRVKEIPKNTINFALGKFAYQSSDYWYKGPAIFAIDGNRSPVFNHGCTHTGPPGDVEDAPWWRLDLLSLYWVSHVVIYNRIEFPERFHDVMITEGTSLDSMHVCAFFPGPGSHANLVLDFICEHIRIVQIIQIQIISGVDNVLTLCEVEVY